MNQTHSSHSKQQVAAISMAASAAMAAGKFTVALLTGSLGVLSEALHSLIDFGATVVTWFAVRWSDLPADDNHHYGHAKIESVAALLEAVLLALTAFYVAYEAVLRLWHGQTPARVEWWAPALIGVAIVVDYNRSHALKAVAKDSSSQALAADAAHFESDMYGSIAVLLGLVGLWLGITWADSAAALVVSGFVGYIGFDLARDTLSTLLDRAPEGMTEQVRDLVEREDGVLRVEQLRVRQAGPITYVAVVADVPRSLPQASVEALKLKLSAAIAAALPGCDLSLALNGVALDSETAFEKVGMIAAAHGLYVHHLTVQQLEERLAVSFDVEMDGATALDAAHEKATELEEAIRQGLGGDVEVESHIEPQPVHLIQGLHADAKTVSQVERALRGLAAKEKLLSDVHNIRVRRVKDGLFVHYHCRFKPNLRIDAVHAVVDRLENQLVAKLPDVKRVVAHAEPVGRAKHKL
ncbi:MAG: cation diffusion facilitator family transporter [Alphaproteobacteria bacterium]|nr:cation diffusion facilitator family transporter [Alphaproteobacteria bacterium]